MLDAFYAILINCAIPVLIALNIWNLLESNVDANKFVESIPIVASLFMAECIVAVLMWQNGIVIGTVQRLQMVIDQR